MNVKFRNKGISIIVPVYNDPGGLRKNIDSLINQNLPTDKYEIIIVDNNSTDNTLKVAGNYKKKYPDLIRIEQEVEIQSSYAARNKGIIRSKADIFAFIDSDCIAARNWLKEGVKILKRKDVDLAGGNVKFIFTPAKSSGEMFDSITNMQISDNIRERKVAKTANLFVKSYVFNEIGLFPANVKSGGDVQWTKRATDRGFKLVFAEKAVVRHPARPLNELLKKQFRVGKGQKELWLNYEKPELPILYYFIRAFLPYRFRGIKQKIIKRGTPDMKAKAFDIWMVSYLVTLFTRAGFIFAWIRDIFKRNSDDNR